MVRTTIIPGLLDTFGVNTNYEMPQRIFEVGNISLLDAEAETGAREVRLAAGGATGPRVDYSEIRAACEALLADLGWSLRTEQDDAPCFIPGRGARVMASRGEGDEERCVGLVGEVHPEVLEGYKLVQPTAVFELNLDLLMA